MVQVYHVPISKDRLQAMPKDERVLFLLLGNAANQMMMFQKLILFATNKKPSSELEKTLTGAQTEMILRLFVGALSEAYELIRTRYLRSPIRRDYEGRLDDGGKTALQELTRQFGGSNLLNKVRNNFSFHFPNTDDVDDALEAAQNDAGLSDLFNLYASEHGFNTFYLVSDLIITHGIRKATGATDLIEAQHALMKEVISAANNIFEFSKAFTAAAWLKHFGEEMLAKEWCQFPMLQK